jgi:hypothetical protein
MNPQEQHEYDHAIQRGHTFFVAHYPVINQEIVDIYNAVKKKKPELIPVGAVRSVSYHKNGEIIKTYCGVELAYVDMPNQVVGGVGHDGTQYFVNSRLIQNARYSPWSGRDHRTKKSKHMNNIVKESLKVLLPTQFSEVVDESENVVDREIHRIREKSREGVIGKLRHLGYSTWRDELLHMASVGYRPQNTDIAQAMDYMVESKEDYERNANYNPEKMFVWIKPNCVMYGNGKDDFQEFKSVDELPENVRGKLFVLMVTDMKVFVDEVGMKFADNKFWVLL